MNKSERTAVLRRLKPATWYAFSQMEAMHEEEVKISKSEFIIRLIVHISDEQFKTIRHYGVYSRRIKTLCKKLISVWQKEVRRWIVKVKKTVKRRKWEQRIKEQTGKDPMVCPHCQCYYEYKGEVCLKDGQLEIKYASCEVARACLERMIENFTGIKATKTQQKEEVSKPEEPVDREGFRQLYLFGV